MTAGCGVAALLRAGGPVRVPLRECCVAALVGADGVVMRCAAAPTPTVSAAPPAPGAPEPASASAVFLATVAGAGDHPEPALREPIEASR